MKIDTLIRLITVMPRQKRDAMTTTDIVALYYKGFSDSVKETIQKDSKMRRVQKYMEEADRDGLGDSGQANHPGRKSPLNLYHLRENQVLAYFLHSKAALNLLWARGLAPQLDKLAAPDDVLGLHRRPGCHSARVSSETRSQSCPTASDASSPRLWMACCLPSRKPGGGLSGQGHH